MRSEVILESRMYNEWKVRRELRTQLDKLLKVEEAKRKNNFLILIEFIIIISATFVILGGLAICGLTICIIATSLLLYSIINAGVLDKKHLKYHNSLRQASNRAKNRATLPQGCRIEGDNIIMEAESTSSNPDQEDYHDELGEFIGYCIVSHLPIYERDEQVSCPKCSKLAHKLYFLEWIKIKGYCPNCGSKLTIMDQSNIENNIFCVDYQ